MSEYYVRHELYRHELLRQYSMTFIKNNTKYGIITEGFCRIAKEGFYYIVNYNAFKCFSCSVMLDFNLCKNSINMKKLHKILNPNCAFLKGSDISITDDKYNPCDVVPRILSKHKQIFDVDIEISYPLLTKNLCSEYSLKNPPLDEVDIFTKKIIYPIFSPIYIPEILNSNKCLDVGNFFLLMRNERMRVESFENKMYPYPFPEVFYRNLANLGFFYTLFNDVIQCAFCRAIYTNVTPKNVVVLHVECKKLRKCVDFRNIANIGCDILIGCRNPIQTEVEEIQCKICYKNQIDVIFECGHLISCEECSQNLLNCPICRQPLGEKKIVYFS